jgi:hypothetical protein
LGEGSENTRNLCAEFLADGRDLILWNSYPDEPSYDDEPSDESSLVIAHAREADHYSNLRPVGDLSYATRVRSGPHGVLIVTQERHGVHVLDLATGRIINTLPISVVGDPIIRSESTHSSEPILIVGTDYGRVIGWNWEADRLLFSRGYFPREDIVWIDSLAIDENEGLVWFAEGSVIYGLSLSDGAVIHEVELGKAFGAGPIAVQSDLRLIAVGSRKVTRLYKRSDNKVQLVFKIAHPEPLGSEVRFSPDGQVLAATSGLPFFGSSLRVVETMSGKVIFTLADTDDEEDEESEFRHAFGPISFSADSELLALGDGSR